MSVGFDSGVQDSIQRLRDALEENQRFHQQINRREAPSFSAFEAFFPDERALSRLLAYLFDGNQGHGQGVDFLAQFLRLIDCNWPIVDCRVQTEYFIWTNGRYLDLLIVVGNHAIGIENKARGAAEQPGQCKDYCEELERRWPGNWLFVFLTPDGGKPESLGAAYENDCRVKLLRCDELAEAFTTCCAPLLPFLASFQRFVRERINGELPLHPGETTMLNELLEERNIDVTVEILVRVGDVRRELLRRFREAMLTRVRGEFKDPTWDAEFRGGASSAPDLNTSCSRLCFFKPAWKGLYAISFSNQAGNAAAVGFGIFYWEREYGKGINRRVADGRLAAELAQSFGTGKSTGHWDWFQYLDRLDMRHYANWYDEDVTRKMAQNGGAQMVNELFPMLKRTIEIAEKYLDQEVAGDSN